MAVFRSHIHFSFSRRVLVGEGRGSAPGSRDPGHQGLPAVPASLTEGPRAAPPWEVKGLEGGGLLQGHFIPETRTFKSLPLKYQTRSWFMIKLPRLPGGALSVLCSLTSAVTR